MSFSFRNFKTNDDKCIVACMFNFTSYFADLNDGFDLVDLNVDLLPSIHVDFHLRYDVALFGCWL